MNGRHLLTKTLAAIPAALVLALAAGPTLAESPCQGLDQRPCEGKSGCTWVDSYTRKDGIKVSGYCRSTGTDSGAADKKPVTKEPEKKAAAPAKEPEKKTAAPAKEPEKKSTAKEKEPEKKPTAKEKEAADSAKKTAK
jgi:hypothetical protein